MHIYIDAALTASARFCDASASPPCWTGQDWPGSVSGRGSWGFSGWRALWRLHFLTDFDESFLYSGVCDLRGV